MIEKNNELKNKVAHIKHTNALTLLARLSFRTMTRYINCEVEHRVNIRVFSKNC